MHNYCMPQLTAFHSVRFRATPRHTNHDYASTHQVLVTGDGNDNDSSCSFPDCVESALRKVAVVVAVTVVVVAVVVAVAVVVHGNNNDR
jgi:hypothetical protein